MSASQYLSKHLPGIASGVVSVTASQDIQTGLKEITAATANISAASVAANEESIVLTQWGGSLDAGVLRIIVKKGGSNHGNAGDSAVNVAFMAHGDR